MSAIKRILQIAMLTICSAPLLYAQEAQVILRSTVTGNQEQPKVLYIVPWQQADKPELIYQPMQSLVEGVFRQVDRDEFLRELRYRQVLSEAQTDAGSP